MIETPNAREPSSATGESRTPDPDPAGGHRAARRALEIIEYVAASPVPASLSDVVREVGLPKSSAHALVRTLDDEGYLQRDDRGMYELGPRLLRLLGSLPHQLELPRVARPIMQGLVDQLGETAILGVRRHASIVYVEEIEAPQFIRYAAPLGEPRPLHCTSIGKIHLAAMAAEDAARLLEQVERESFTPYTRTDIEAIMAELDTVRTQGYALNREESMSGVIGLAVPVFEAGRPDGRLLAGLCTAGPADRVRGLIAAAPALLTEAAGRIGASMSPR
jgi:DNA-binding IclR family transcriptional regulator